MIEPNDTDSNDLTTRLHSKAARGKPQGYGKHGGEPKGLRLKCCHWPLSIRVTHVDRDWYRFTLDQKVDGDDKE